MKLQNSIETSFSVSAIQYTSDLWVFFFYQWRLKKATKKASYTCTVAFISVFPLVWTTDENEFSHHLASRQSFTVLHSKKGDVWDTVANICVNETSKCYWDFFLSVSYSIYGWSVVFFLSVALEKGDEKSVLYMYCRFHQRFPFSVDDRWKRKKNTMRCGIKRIIVGRWKSSKMLAWWRNYFASFSSKWKRGLLKIHKWGRGLHSGQIAGVPPD